jgi:tetratricopeptide (TPR) repeat protein
VAASGAPASPAPRYTLYFGWEQRQYEIEVSDHVWNPDTYVDLARSRLEGAPRPEGGARHFVDEEMLASLTDLRVAVLQEQNRRLSESLAQDRLDPQLHEQAALLLGAFALREAAKTLADERYAMCRMAAHLAVARGIRNGAEVGLSGRVAEILVLTLVGRQMDAVTALERLQTQSASTPGIEAWARALRLRNTGDWRRNKGRGATRLEQLEEFRALRYRLPPDAPERYLDEIDAAGDTIGHRLILGGGATVADCARFAGTAVPTELEEVDEVRSGFGDASPSDEAALVSGLNEAPAPGGVRWSPHGLGFMVLDRGLWAAFLQRHLCSALAGTSHCYRHEWGLAEEAAAYSQEATKRFSKLSLFPFVALGLASDQETYGKAFASAVRVLETAPHQANAASWVTVRDKRPGSFRGRVPDPTLWFTPAFPRNTLFDVPGRFRELDALKIPTVEQGAAWRALAPYDAEINWTYLWQVHAGRGPVDEMMRGSALFLDYDAWMLTRVVELAFEQAKTDPATYKDVARRLCSVNPDYWRTFGYQLVRLDDSAGAAEAFRAMVDHSRDEVLVSNSLLWLVLYELEHGRTGQARQLAGRAAAAYSERGLNTMGLFLEKAGEYDRALDYFRKIVERYESRSELAAFYLRNQRRFRGTAIEREIQPVVDEVFPHGLENVQRERLSGPPTDGLLVEGNPWNVRHAGLLIGDVIVGINGKHARTKEQYAAIVYLDPSSLWKRINLLVWRNDRYIEVLVYRDDPFGIRPYP